MTVPPRPHRWTAAAAALLAAAVLVGCGSGSTGGSTTGTPATTTPPATAPATTPQRTARVSVFMPLGDPGSDCDRVRPVARTVPAPAVLHAAMAALLQGPTPAERRAGYDGWFSADTAGALRGVTLRDGVAHIDFADLRRLIPNASSSCGSALLLAQLDRTAAQFPAVRRAVYSLDGDVAAFYEWLGYDAPPG